MSWANLHLFLFSSDFSHYLSSLLRPTNSSPPSSSDTPWSFSCSKPQGCHFLSCPDRPLLAVHRLRRETVWLLGCLSVANFDFFPHSVTTVSLRGSGCWLAETNFKFATASMVHLNFINFLFLADQILLVILGWNESVFWSFLYRFLALAPGCLQSQVTLKTKHKNGSKSSFRFFFIHWSSASPLLRQTILTTWSRSKVKETVHLSPDKKLDFIVLCRELREWKIWFFKTSSLLSPFPFFHLAIDSL